MSVFKKKSYLQNLPKYSNSVCDLLIVKILSPDLIIILVYRPPSSPLSDFDDIITKTREFIISLPAPLPNIILIGDFNMPEVICDNPHAYNPCCCCLPTPMKLASGGESDVPACGPPASFSVHLVSSAVTPAGSVHKSRGDNVVCMWVQLKR